MKLKFLKFETQIIHICIKKIHAKSNIPVSHIFA